VPDKGKKETKGLANDQKPNPNVGHGTQDSTPKEPKSTPPPTEPKK